MFEVSYLYLWVKILDDFNAINHDTTSEDETTVHWQETEVVTFGSGNPELSIVLSVLIALVCLTGNSAVLFFFTRSKSIAKTRVFELAFAVLDIFVCLVLLPVFVLSPMQFIKNNNSAKFVLLIAEAIVGPIAFNGYYSLLVCVAIDRFCAVFYPLQFKIIRNAYINKMLLSVVSFTILSATAGAMGVTIFSLYIINLTVMFIFSVIAILVIVVLFTAIVVRIRRNSAQRAALGVEEEDGQHLRAVKMFCLITAFYLLGYVPFGFSKSGLVAREFEFLYFVNHLCNPFIYFIFNTPFRGQVINLFSMC